MREGAEQRAPILAFPRKQGKEQKHAPSLAKRGRAGEGALAVGVLPSFPHSLLPCKAMSANPFSSDFLRSDHDDARRPHNGLSYVRGKTDEPLKFMTVPALLDRAVLRHGGRDAVIFAPSGE